MSKKLKIRSIQIKPTSTSFLSFFVIIKIVYIYFMRLKRAETNLKINKFQL